MKKKFEATVVYEELWEAIQAKNEDGSRRYNLILLEGGSRSSKTWSIIQALILYGFNKNLRVSCFRDKSTWTRETIWNDLQKNLEYMGIFDPENVNKQNMDYRLGATMLEFRGLDDIARTRSRTQDITWINEALDVNKDMFDELEQRTNDFCILDYNPVLDQCWVYDLRKRSDVYWMHSTMLDNPFLPAKITAKIKGYEPTEENAQQGTVDKYKWQVYGLGKPARREGTVFTNWKECKEIHLNAKFLGYGLDFGYTNDPSACVAMYEYDHEIYLDEIFYETGLLNSDICDKFEAIGVTNEEIVADSAEPKSIAEIHKNGYRVKSCTKGKDSINYGIDLLKDRQVYFTERSNNLKQEFRNYIWLQDKDGKSLNKPIDKDNHLMDATRYIAMEKLRSKKETASVSQRADKIAMMKKQLQARGVKV